MLLRNSLFGIHAPPRLGYKPYGKPDNRILEEDDPFGWKISEMEEEYELKPGLNILAIR